jgi:hypothetical protein
VSAAQAFKDDKGNGIDKIRLVSLDDDEFDDDEEDED